MTSYKLEWFGEELKAAIEQAAHEGDREAAELVLRRANARVPFRTGALERVGMVKLNKKSASVRYRNRYGWVLRQHSEWHYRGGRSARWLDEAVVSTVSEVEDIYARQIRRVLGD